MHAEAVRRSLLAKADVTLTQLVAPAVLGMLLVPACRNSNVLTASYATLDEARASGAVAGGYLPDGLPPSARDIREAHDPDSRERWALFSFSPTEAGQLRAIVGAQEVSLDGEQCEVPGRLEWWPILLRGRLDAERIRSTGLLTYRNGDRLFAVNWSQGRAYLWTSR
jgi:hypothetical protein